MKSFPAFTVLLLFTSLARAGTPDFDAWTRDWRLDAGDPRACGTSLVATHVRDEKGKDQLTFEVPTASGGLQRRFTFPNVNARALWQRGDQHAFWAVRSRLKSGVLARTSRGCFGFSRFFSVCERWIKDYTATVDGADGLHVVIAEASDYPIHCAYTASAP